MTEHWSVFREPVWFVEPYLCMDCDYCWVGVRALAADVACPHCGGDWVVEPEEYNSIPIVVH